MPLCRRTATPTMPTSSSTTATSRARCSRRRSSTCQPLSWRRTHRGDGVPRIRRGRRRTGAPLLVAFDRATERSRVGLRSAITTATQAPGAVAMSLGQVAGADRHDIEIADAVTDPARVSSEHPPSSRKDRGRTLRDDPRRPEPAPPDPSAPRSCSCSVSAWVPDQVGWPTAVAAHRAATTSTDPHFVDLQPTSTINLFGSGADLGFWVAPTTCRIR